MRRLDHVWAELVHISVERWIHFVVDLPPFGWSYKWHVEAYCPDLKCNIARSKRNLKLQYWVLHYLHRCRFHGQVPAELVEELPSALLDSIDWVECSSVLVCCPYSVERMCIDLSTEFDHSIGFDWVGYHSVENCCWDSCWGKLFHQCSVRCIGHWMVMVHFGMVILGHVIQLDPIFFLN